MTEAAKTITHLVAAGVVLAIAILSRPEPPSMDADVDTATALNPVEDPLSATRLEIVKFNEATASVSRFEVAKVDEMWVIPSHDNYPADAEQQMADAATSVMNLDILGMVTSNRGDHATYGVVDPDVEKLKPGEVGVGTRVTMMDAKNNNLVNMVIGKEVKDQPDQRYVREVRRDPVYIVNLDPDKLTTKFEDWIEGDLLKLSPWDIRQVTLNDYSVDLALGARGIEVVWDRRNKMTFAYDDSETKWTAKELLVYDKAAETFEPVQLPENEEVNSDKLNELKNALDDLKIVDVQRKPEGLSRDLRAEADFANNREAVEDLFEKGFIPVQTSRDQFEILSTDGDIVCQMKDGEEYVLRFGKLVVGSSDGGQPEEADEAGGATAESESSDAAQQGGQGINRYLFVMARFNENVLEKPELEPLPELPPDAQVDTEDAAAPSDDTNEPEPDKDAPPEAETESTPATPAPEPADETDTPTDNDAADSGDDGAQDTEEESPAPPDDEGNGAGDTPAVSGPDLTQGNGETTAEETDAQAEPPASSDDEASPAQGPAVAAETSDATAPSDSPAEPTESDDTEAAEEAPATDAAAEEGKADGESAPADEESLEELIEKRKEIEKGNQRKLDEYKDKVEKAKDRVQELNDRFADFYYIIPDDVFQKIHLSRDECIKEKEQEEDKDASDSSEEPEASAEPGNPLRQLESLEEGVE